MTEIPTAAELRDEMRKSIAVLTAALEETVTTLTSAAAVCQADMPNFAGTLRESAEAGRAALKRCRK